jgi:NADH-quinone oxidoreductase subunit G
MPVATRLTAEPSNWVTVLAGVAAAVAAEKGTSAPVQADSDETARAVAKALLSGERKAVLLGNAAAQHPQASALLALANWIGEQTGASVGYLTESANTVGAQLVGALPKQGGKNAGQMLAQPLKAYLLFNVEPALDSANPAAAMAALGQAEMVVAFAPFKNVALDVADVLLPISPFSETAGTFVNAEGRMQSFHGTVKPQGETRPGWKVLRVLGNLLDLEGFNYETADEVRAEALGDGSGIAAKLSNAGASLPSSAARNTGAALERIADVPIYHADMLVRRSPPLQMTADAKNAPFVGVSASVWDRLGLSAGAAVRVSQGNASAVLPARLEPSLAANAVRVPAGHPATAMLGAMFGELSVEKA